MLSFFGSDVILFDFWQVIPGFRVRIIPVMGTIPAIFGQVMASYVVTNIANFSVDYEPLLHLDTELYQTLHQRLIEREEIRFGSASGVEVRWPEFVFTLPSLLDILISIEKNFRWIWKKLFMLYVSFGMGIVQEIRCQGRLQKECGVMWRTWHWPGYDTFLALTQFPYSLVTFLLLQSTPLVVSRSFSCEIALFFNEIVHTSMQFIFLFFPRHLLLLHIIVFWRVVYYVCSSYTKVNSFLDFSHLTIFNDNLASCSIFLSFLFTCMLLESFYCIHVSPWITSMFSAWIMFRLWFIFHILLLEPWLWTQKFLLGSRVSSSRQNSCCRVCLRGNLSSTWLFN